MNQAPLLVELFTEELPPKSLKLLGEQFSKKLFERLITNGLVKSGTSYRSFATPRRLAVYIEAVLPKAADQLVQEKLLPVSIGLDPQGNPTAPLLKKLQALGMKDVPVEQLERSGTGKNEVLSLQIQKIGLDLQSGLQDALDFVVQQLPIAKTMHYQLNVGTPEEVNVQFVRPAHSLIALYDALIIPVHVLGLTAGNTTQGHRFLSPGMITIDHAKNYETILLTQGKVLANFDDRLQSIDRQLHMAAGAYQVLKPQSLLEEVTALVEWPVVYTCHFEEAFLEVPQECLILTMQTNQKYFALTRPDGQLMNQFCIVSNIETTSPAAIIAGNERVIRPRLSDARFFFTQDRKRKLSDRIPDLSKVVYHNLLGTQLDRSNRIAQIAEQISNAISKSKNESNAAQVSALCERAALLIKTDLLTDMVGEFPELQGIMGGYYAKHDGENPEVIAACSEHYLPRFSGDTLPKTRVGLTLALADKLETLVGIWGIGLQPTGEKDPFALRRHALGIIRLLIENQLAISIQDLLDMTRQAFTSEKVLSCPNWHLLTQFINDRLRSYLKEQNNVIFKPEEIEAVLSQENGFLYQLPLKLLAVRTFGELAQAASLANANKRISNILKKNLAVLPPLNPKLLHQKAEQELFQSMQTLAPQIASAHQTEDFKGSLILLASISNLVSNFFEEVMVMDPNLELQQNRLALLKDLHQSMSMVADLSQLAQ